MKTYTVLVFGKVSSKQKRTHILIHKANSPKELQGCLAPGVDFGFVNGEWAVVNSTAAFNVLMTELAGEAAQLTIIKD